MKWNPHWSRSVWYYRSLSPTISPTWLLEKVNPTCRRTRTIYYVTQKTGQIRMLLLEKKLAFVSFQNPSISISLFQAGRYGCLFSRYLVEWQRVWLISCCWRPGPIKGCKKKQGLSLSESSHGSCSFFAWLGLREAGYLADDKCSCTLSCLKTPADAKPWQPVRLPPPQPRAFNLSLSSCETNQWQPLFAQVGGRFSRVL